MIVQPDGGVIDDLIVYRLAEERFLVVANASNATVVSDELAARLAGARAILDDRSLAMALCAVQGPRSVDIVGPLTGIDVAGLRYYGIAEGEVAGLGRVVKLGKSQDFVGRGALEKVSRDGPSKRLVGLVLRGRGIARHGYPVHAEGRRSGVVTSGTMSPTLGEAIAMAYVAPGDA